MNTARIHQQLRFLAERCDGARGKDHQGFNKFDAKRGKELAKQEELTLQEAQSATKLLKKYGKQLKELDEEMSQYDDMEFNLDEYDEAGGAGLPAPVGTHICRIACEDLAQIGQSNMGFKIRGTVVEANWKGYVVEDILFTSDKAMGRLKMALHRVSGIEGGKLTARSIKEALDGKLALLTVDRVVFNRKGDSEEYTEAQALAMKANGEKMYGHAKMPFAGYESATAEDVARYGERGPRPAGTATSSNGTGQPAESTRLPF